MTYCDTVMVSCISSVSGIPCVFISSLVTLLGWAGRIINHLVSWYFGVYFISGFFLLGGFFLLVRFPRLLEP